MLFPVFFLRRWFLECITDVQLSFTVDPTPSTDTATSADGIAATRTRWLLGVLALGIYPIPLDEGSPSEAHL